MDKRAVVLLTNLRSGKTGRITLCLDCEGESHQLMERLRLGIQQILTRPAPDGWQYDVIIDPPSEDTARVPLPVAPSVSPLPAKAAAKPTTIKSLYGESQWVPDEAIAPSKEALAQEANKFGLAGGLAQGEAAPSIAPVAPSPAVKKAVPKAKAPAKAAPKPTLAQSLGEPTE